MGDENKSFTEALINTDRIDLVLGIDYVDYYERKLKTEFFKQLHLKHKRSFNGLKDGGYKGESDFLNRFNSLIDAIKKDKVNHVQMPVYKLGEDNYWLYNGYHRFSILYRLFYFVLCL